MHFAGPRTRACRRGIIASALCANPVAWLPSLPARQRGGRGSERSDREAHAHALTASHSAAGRRCSSTLVSRLAARARRRSHRQDELSPARCDSPFSYGSAHAIVGARAAAPALRAHGLPRRRRAAIRRHKLGFPPDNRWLVRLDHLRSPGLKSTKLKKSSRPTPPHLPAPPVRFLTRVDSVTVQDRFERHRSVSYTPRSKRGPHGGPRRGMAGRLRRCQSPDFPESADRCHLAHPVVAVCARNWAISTSGRAPHTPE